MAAYDVNSKNRPRGTRIKYAITGRMGYEDDIRWS